METLDCRVREPLRSSTDDVDRGDRDSSASTLVDGRQSDGRIIVPWIEIWTERKSLHR